MLRSQNEYIISIHAKDRVFSSTNFRLNKTSQF